jgi:hypothetical protein
MILPVMHIINPCVKLQDFRVRLINCEHCIRERLNIFVVIEVSVSVVELSLLKFVKMLV